MVMMWISANVFHVMLGVLHVQCLTAYGSLDNNSTEDSLTRESNFSSSFWSKTYQNTLMVMHKIP